MAKINTTMQINNDNNKNNNYNNKNNKTLTTTITLTSTTMTTTTTMMMLISICKRAFYDNMARKNATTTTTETKTTTTTKSPKCPSLSGILTNQLRIWYRTKKRGFARQKLTIWPQKWFFKVPSFVESVFGVKCPFFESWYPFFILWIVFLTYLTDFQKKKPSCFQKMDFWPKTCFFHR